MDWVDMRCKLSLQNKFRWNEDLRYTVKNKSLSCVALTSLDAVVGRK